MNVENSSLNNVVLEYFIEKNHQNKEYIDNALSEEFIYTFLIITYKNNIDIPLLTIK